MTYKGPNNVWGYKIINKSNGIDYIKFEESNNSFIEASKPEIDIMSENKWLHSNANSMVLYTQTSVC